MILNENHPFETQGRRDLNGDIVGQGCGTGIVNKASLAVFSNLRGIMDR